MVPTMLTGLDRGDQNLGDYVRIGRQVLAGASVAGQRVPQRRKVRGPYKLLVVKQSPRA